jgi:leucyl aminopeptidase
MSAKTFYSAQDTKAISLKFISFSDFEVFSKTADKRLLNIMNYQKFQGKTGDMALIHDENGLLDCVYLGVDEEAYTQALANAAKNCPAGTYKLEISLSNDVLVYWALAQYRFKHYKKTEDESKVLLLEEKTMAAVLALADAIFLVRDLINCPANDMGPKDLAFEMEKLAKRSGGEFKQWQADELLEANFPAIHAVGRAAIDPPRLLSFRWGNEKAPLVTLVGKGVCFDSGGLDLKSSSAMRLMKKDMGGAAHVLGLAQWICDRQLPICLQVYVPAVENLVSANAFKPGDVLTMRDGTTVEVDNTDAEGRLVLADAISKACEEEMSLLIDFATLTGAARVAVGTKVAAMFANNDDLAAEISAFAARTEDPVWQLPLFQPYKKMLNSQIADMSNGSDSPYAGAITAALFLEHFVKTDAPWLHFDIMAWNVGSEPGKPEGGEAMAIRALAAYFESRFADKQP